MTSSCILMSFTVPSLSILNIFKFGGLTLLMLFPQFYFNNNNYNYNFNNNYYNYNYYVPARSKFNDNNVTTLLSVLFACSTYHDIDVKQFLLVLQFLSLDLYIL